MVLSGYMGARIGDSAPPWPDYVRLCRAYRLRTGLIQKDFAALMGLSQCAVSKWETGRACPTPRHVKDICGVCAAWYSDRPGGDDAVYTALYDALMDAVTAHSLDYARRDKARRRCADAASA